MSLKVRVKVGDVTSLSEARYCAGMGVDLIGFPVGAGGLAPDQYKQIMDWITGPEFVLEVAHLSVEDIDKVTSQYPGHYVLVNARQLAALRRSDIQFYVALTEQEWEASREQLKSFANVAGVELLNSGIEMARQVALHFPVLLHLHDRLDVNDVLASGVNGISLTGAAEERPGLQDYSRLAAVLEQLEED